MMPRVAAIVLAAGMSTRMAPDNKLLLRDGQGRAMVARVVAACVASRVARVVVVTGHQAAAVENAARDGVEPGRIDFVRAADFAHGMSASLRAGIEALPPEIDGALICLGDMPLVGAAVLDRLIAAFARHGDVVVPAWRGRRGNPVLWDRWFFAEIAGLCGDTGARALLARHAARVREVEVQDESILVDFDTSPA